MGAPASAGAGVRAGGRRRVAQLASIASGSKRDHAERRGSARTARPTWCGKVYICRFFGVWFAGSFLITSSPDIIGSASAFRASLPRVGVSDSEVSASARSAQVWGECADPFQTSGDRERERRANVAAAETLGDELLKVGVSAVVFYFNATT